MLLQVKEADTMAQSFFERQEKLDWIARVEALYHAILKDRECLSLKDLAVTGRDLIQAGFEPGPELGKSSMRCSRMYWNTRNTIRKNICYSTLIR